MNNNATRVMNAAVAGQKVMDDNSVLWNSKTIIANKKSAIDDKIDEIAQLNDNITNTIGATTAKIRARQQAAKSALRLCKPMLVFARDTNNHVLAEEINIRWSKFRYGKDQTVINRWQLVHDRADLLKTQLAADDYIETSWISQLQSEIDTFKTLRGKVKAKRSDIAALNAQVTKGIKELQAIKTDLIDLLVQYKESDPIFYKAATSAFELNVTGKRHIALRLHFIDRSTGIRLRNVQAQFAEIELIKTASRNGRIDFWQQELPQGNYVLHVKLKHFAEQTIHNVAIKAGKFKLMEITMDKIALNTTKAA